MPEHSDQRNEPESTPVPPGHVDETDSLDGLRQLLGVDKLSDRMRERMQRVIDGMDAADGHTVAGPRRHRAAAPDPTDMSWPHLPGCAAPSCAKLAEQILADARRASDDIIATAHRVAAEMTEAAMTQAEQSVRRIHRTGQQPHPPATTGHERQNQNPPVLATSPDADAEATGRRWCTQLIEAGAFFPAGKKAVRRALSGYAAVLTQQLGSGQALLLGRQLGTELIELGANQPQTVAVSLTVLARHLIGARPELTEQVSDVLAAVAAGFAAGLRDDVLRQQESLQLAARVAAEQSSLSLRAGDAPPRRLAMYDPLTGLAGRTLLMQRLQQTTNRAGARSRQVGLCLIDLTRFSSINYRYGFDVGDQVLINVARTLQAATRHDGPIAQDYLLTRVGSDDFAILIEDSAGYPHMVELAEKIHEALATPIDVPSTAIKVQARIGIVVVSAAHADGNTMLINAEAAVRQARRTRTRWAVHAGTAPSTVPAPADLETVPLAFQPILATREDTLHGVETIARWRHPRLGDLDLRSVGQLTGNQTLVTRLAQDLLRDACTHAAQWPDPTSGAYLSIDLPVHQIGRDNLGDLILDALTETGMRPHRLQLQLSRGDIAPSELLSTTWLTRLAALGIRLALDDFGTIGTDLAYLRRLPLHELRAPAHAFTTSTTSPSTADRDLMKAVAVVAHSMKLQLTVHSVDTAAYAEAITGTGCDAVQGRHYTEPLPANSCADFLRTAPRYLTGTR